MDKAQFLNMDIGEAMERIFSEITSVKDEVGSLKDDVNDVKSHLGMVSGGDDSTAVVYALPGGESLTFQSEEALDRWAELKSRKMLYYGCEHQDKAIAKYVSGEINELPDNLQKLKPKHNMKVVLG